MKLALRDLWMSAVALGILLASTFWLPGPWALISGGASFLLFLVMRGAYARVRDAYTVAAALAQRECSR